jgi:hypothetical protein
MNVMSPVMPDSFGATDTLRRRKGSSTVIVMGPTVRSARSVVDRLDA